MSSGPGYYGTPPGAHYTADHIITISMNTLETIGKWVAAVILLACIAVPVAVDTYCTATGSAHGIVGCAHN